MHAQCYILSLKSLMSPLVHLTCFSLLRRCSMVRPRVGKLGARLFSLSEGAVADEEEIMHWVVWTYLIFGAYLEVAFWVALLKGVGTNELESYLMYECPQEEEGLNCMEELAPRCFQVDLVTKDQNKDMCLDLEVMLV
ncbi:hypothetical protein Tco_0739608 [Tanacetum coccineum]